MPTRHLVTSESVSEGHPGEVADRISDELDGNRGAEANLEQLAWADALRAAVG